MSNVINLKGNENELVPVKVLVKGDEYSGKVWEVILPDLTHIENPNLIIEETPLKAASIIAAGELVEMEVKGKEIPTPSEITEEERNSYDFAEIIEIDMAYERKVFVCLNEETGDLLNPKQAELQEYYNFCLEHDLYPSEDHVQELISRF